LVWLEKNIIFLVIYFNPSQQGTKIIFFSFDESCSRSFLAHPLSLPAHFPFKIKVFIHLLQKARLCIIKTISDLTLQGLGKKLFIKKVDIYVIPVNMCVDSTNLTINYQ
jgi:hypothetical protein